MSRFIVVLIISISTTYAIEFHSYRDAIALQKKNHKVIMLDIVRTHCHYCIDMQKNVFDNPSMSKWLEERFIVVKINHDSDKLPLGIEVNFTPSFYFIDKNQKILKTIPGAWNIEDFKDLTRKIK